MKISQFTKQHLVNELKANGLPYSRDTIKRYELQGIILFPDKPIKFASGRVWRGYSWKRIQQNVARVKRYQKTKNEG